MRTAVKLRTHPPAERTARTIIRGVLRESGTSRDDALEVEVIVAELAARRHLLSVIDALSSA